MASTINASNSGFGGIVSTGDSSGQLQLQTANTTAVTIDTSQNVGIGTTSPAAKLDISGGINTTGIVNFGGTGGGNTLNLWGVNGVGLRIASTTTSTSSYITQEASSELRTNLSGFGTWYTGGAEKMRIDSNGNVLVGTSSLSPTQSGVIIQQNNSANSVVVTYKTSAAASSTSTTTLDLSTIGVSNSLYFICEVTAGAYGNSNSGNGLYKGILYGYSGGSVYQSITSLTNTITGGTWTLSGGTNSVSLALQNTNTTQTKFAVIRFEITWG